MATKTKLGRPGVLLLGALFLMGCGDKGGDTPSKDESRQDEDDDSSKKKKKKKKKKKSKKKDDEKTAPDDNAVFTARDPKAGDRLKETSKQTMHLELDAGGRKITIDEVTNKEKEEEVLDVAQGRPAKMKVTYLKRTKTKTQGGKESTEVEPIEGKTYIVEDDGTGAAKVTYEDGTKVPAEELKLVKKDFRRTFKPSPASKKIEKALLEAKLEKGKRVRAAEEAFAAYFLEGEDDDDPGEETKVTEVKLTYQGTKGDRAVFDIEFTMNVDKKPLVFAMPLKGQLEVLRAGVTPIAMTMKGPVEMDGSKMSTPLKATGQLMMATQATAIPKK